MLIKVRKESGFAILPVVIGLLLLGGIFFGTKLVQQRQSTTPQAADNSATPIAVYKIHNKVQGEWHWTWNEQEANNLVAQGTHDQKSIAFYAYRQENHPTGTVPLFFLSRHSNPPQTYITADQTEVARLIVPNVWNGEQDDRLSRAFNAGYTNNWSIRDQSVFVYPSTAYDPSVIPVFRVEHEIESAFFRGPASYFTADQGELNGLLNISAGNKKVFRNMGIMFYAHNPAAQPNPTTPPNPTNITLNAPPSVSKTDQTITFTWNIGSGATGSERINIYQVGAPNNAPLGSIFINCSNQPSTPVPSGNCPVPNVLAGQDAAKKYEARMFAADGQTVLATSSPIELKNGTQASPNPQPAGLRTGLEAYWRLDESVGDTFQENINGNTAKGNVPAIEGKVGWSRDFRPQPSPAPFLTVNEKTNFNHAQFSVNSWIYPRSFGSWASIYNHRSNDNFGMTFELTNSAPTKAGALHCWTTGGGLESITKLPLNQWSMVSCTFDQNKNLSIYINGKLDATTKLNNDITYSPNAVIF